MPSPIFLVGSHVYQVKSHSHKAFGQDKTRQGKLKKGEVLYAANGRPATYHAMPLLDDGLMPVTLLAIKMLAVMDGTKLEDAYA